MTYRLKIVISYIAVSVITIIACLLVQCIGSKDIKNIYNNTVYIKAITNEETSIGTGIVYKIKDEKAYIITCYHILEDSNIIYIYNKNKSFEQAKLLKHDELNDIALLEIDNSLDLKNSKFDKTKIDVGEEIYILGNPLNDNYIYTLTHGIISYPNRKIDIETRYGKNIYEAIQLDASINAGDSGGPVFNKSGKVIGMIFIKEDNAEGIGFAIPINKILSIVDNWNLS